MQNRLRMLMAVTSLLYIGPLVAGLGGYGWTIVPVFASIFMVWLFVLRPHQWPQTRADWLRPEALVSLLTQGVVQLLLVAVLFGVGRGIGGVLGTLPVISAVLPLSISFLSIPLARMVWDPWKADQTNRFLDDAIARGKSDPIDANPELTLARRLIAPLSDLPDDTSEHDIARHLNALSSHAVPADIRKALFEAVRDEVASRAQTIALILHNTDPALVAEVPGDGPTMTLALLPKQRDLLSLFARRLTAALDQDPEIWGKCPSVDMLADLVKQFDNTEAEAPLRYLIDATNRAQPEDGLA